MSRRFRLALLSVNQLIQMPGREGLLQAETKLIKVLTVLGVPGVALGVFYLLLKDFSFSFSEVPPSLSALIAILFIAVVGSVAIYALHRWSPVRSATRDNDAPQLPGPRVETLDSVTIDHPPTSTLSNLTVEAIADTINSAPPFQAKTVAQSFSGIRVHWSGFLHGVDPWTNSRHRIRVQLYTKRQGCHSIYFDTTVSKHPEFKVLEDGTIVSILGIIESASGQGLYVHLKPIQIAFGGDCIEDSSTGSRPCPNSIT
jgi:hypothetical protein